MKEAQIWSRFLPMLRSSKTLEQQSWHRWHRMIHRHLVHGSCPPVQKMLQTKEEHHQRHTKHAGDLEIYQAFLKSAGYASHLAAHPSHKISFTLFKRAKCPCIAV